MRSHTSMMQYYVMALQHGAVDLQIIIVGHKSDKAEHRTVEQREGRAVKTIIFCMFTGNKA